MPLCLMVYPGITSEETWQMCKNVNSYLCVDKCLGFSTPMIQLYNIPKQA